MGSKTLALIGVCWFGSPTMVTESPGDHHVPECQKFYTNAEVDELINRSGTTMSQLHMQAQERSDPDFFAHLAQANDPSQSSKYKRLKNAREFPRGNVVQAAPVSVPNPDGSRHAKPVPGAKSNFVITYGPPGTGKTFLRGHYQQVFYDTTGIAPAEWVRAEIDNLVENDEHYQSLIQKISGDDDGKSCLSRLKAEILASKKYSSQEKYERLQDIMQTQSCKKMGEKMPTAYFGLRKGYVNPECPGDCVQTTAGRLNLDACPLEAKKCYAKHSLDNKNDANLTKWLREGRNITYETTGKWFNHWLWDPKQDFLKPHHEVTMVLPLVSDEAITKRVKARWVEKIGNADNSARFVQLDNLSRDIADSRRNIIKYIKELGSAERERLLSLSQDELKREEMSGREKIPAKFGDPPVHNLIVYDNTGGLDDQIAYTTLKLRTDGTDFKPRPGYVQPEYFLAALKSRSCLNVHAGWFGEALKRSQQAEAKPPSPENVEYVSVSGAGDLNMNGRYCRKVSNFEWLFKPFCCHVCSGLAPSSTSNGGPVPKQWYEHVNNGCYIMYCPSFGEWRCCAKRRWLQPANIRYYVKSEALVPLPDGWVTRYGAAPAPLCLEPTRR